MLIHFILVDTLEVVYTINSTAAAVAYVLSKRTTSYSKQPFHTLQKQLQRIKLRRYYQPPTPDGFFPSYMVAFCYTLEAWSYINKGQYKKKGYVTRNPTFLRDIYFPAITMYPWRATTLLDPDYYSKEFHPMTKGRGAHPTTPTLIVVAHHLRRPSLCHTSSTSLPNL